MTFAASSHPPSAHGGARPMDKRTRGTIYFISDSQTMRVKIGFATSLKQRKSQLQVGHWDELYVLERAPGTLADEGRLKVIFEPLRIRGEWFRLEQPIFDLFQRLEAHREKNADCSECETEDEIWNALDAVPIDGLLDGIKWVDLYGGTHG